MQGLRDFSTIWGPSELQSNFWHLGRKLQFRYTLQQNLGGIPSPTIDDINPALPIIRNSAILPVA